MAKRLVCLLFIGLLCVAASASASASASVWTSDDGKLVIRDETANMSAEQFNRTAEKTRSTMDNIRKYWLADQEYLSSEVIRVEFAHSVSGTPNSLFFFRQENGRRVKVVRVFGGGEKPQQLAHKLTSAVFPHGDKLIRNMMGEASERQFGNPASFPVCGAGADEWVAVLIQTGSFIPLAKIGTGHADWGMAIVDNVPVIKDRKKQHAAYIEAGSFGQYLIDVFGQAKMKEFFYRADMTHRPWREVFGYPLEDLERQWLAQVKRKTAERPEAIATLAGFWQQDPRTACFQMQRQTKGMKL